MTRWCTFSLYPRRCGLVNLARRLAAVLVVVLGAIGSLKAGEPVKRLPLVSPQEAGMDSARLNGIDSVVRQALDRGQLPGAVVLVVHQGKIVFRKAYGRRSLQPVVESMTVDTVFDLASLTKPLATATSLMLLLEQ